jgi:hypothetical protein
VTGQSDGFREPVGGRGKSRGNEQGNYSPPVGLLEPIVSSNRSALAKWLFEGSIFFRTSPGTYRFTQGRGSIFPISVVVTLLSDRLCGLVVTVPGYRSRKPRLDSRRYQIF